ncbi:MAG: hypothetical protein M5U18_18740 [Dehalococcoidia bacterium]|nr:hypothetical protein [Dehalococcoidia bacterium]
MKRDECRYGDHDECGSAADESRRLSNAPRHPPQAARKSVLHAPHLGRLFAARSPRRLQDFADVPLGAFERDAEFVGDLLVAVPLRQQVEHVALARSQSGVFHDWKVTAARPPAPYSKVKTTPANAGTSWSRDPAL